MPGQKRKKFEIKRYSELSARQREEVVGIKVQGMKHFHRFSRWHFGPGAAEWDLARKQHLIALESERPVAYAEIAERPGRILMGEIYSVERGKGAGSALYSHIMIWLKKAKKSSS